MKKICIIGSINVDLIGKAKRFPMPGEAVKAKSFGQHPGGKGANQAVAIGKLGLDVCLIGKVGQDSYGDFILNSLNQNGVKTDYIFRDRHVNTGISLIYINEAGENCIVNYRGANDKIKPDEIDRVSEVIKSSDIILLQLEIPYRTNLKIIQEFSNDDRMIILDPAPFSDMSDDMFSKVAIMTPNKVEMGQLTGITINDEEDSLKASRILQQKGVETVINKLGEMGAFLLNKDFSGLIGAFDIKSVNSVGAGDAFNGGLAYGLSKGNNIYKSALIGNLVAALSVSKDGVQESMPSKKELVDFIKDNSIKDLVI